MKFLTLSLIAVVLAAAVYLAGYWPQHQRISRLNDELRVASSQLAEAQGEIRIYQLANRLLGLIEKTEQKNYGEAQRLSSDFFDRVRSEISPASKPSIQSLLESTLQKRDMVTAGLTKGDSATLDLLRQILTGFRQAAEAGMASPAAPGQRESL